MRKDFCSTVIQSWLFLFCFSDHSIRGVLSIQPVDGVGGEDTEKDTNWLIKNTQIPSGVWRGKICSLAVCPEGKGNGV